MPRSPGIPFTMLTFAMVLLLGIHGTIHLLGTAKAFGRGKFTALKKEISLPAGLCWALATLAFLSAAAGLLLGFSGWWLVAAAGLVVSQALILTAWTDARYGTLPNLILAVAVVLMFGQWRFEHHFYRDAALATMANPPDNSDLLTEADIAHLPAPVQRYIRYTGSLQKPLAQNMRLRMEGQMRDRGKDWFPIHSVQFNDFRHSTRLFFMKGRMFGLEVPGYHSFQGFNASMDIRLFGMISLVEEKGPWLRQAETVTLFNDMCLMAPSTLTDKRIQWQSPDSNSVKARFTHQGITINATLFFNDEGQLVNFESEDRISLSDLKPHRFSTPCGEYRMFGGLRLPAYAETIWHYPEGKFVYGKFRIRQVEWNVTRFPKYRHENQ